MTNKLVFLFFFYFFLNNSVFAQCDSTETKYCTQEIEGSLEGIDSEVTCLDSNRLVISIDKFDWGYYGTLLSHSYTHFTYDNERNLTLSESPAITKDIYTWLPGHRVASYQQDVFYGGNWLTYQRTLYSYNANNLLTQINTRYNFYKAYTRNDSIAENFYYDSNGNDTLSLKDSIVNGQSFKSRIRSIFFNDLKVAEFGDSWLDSSGVYVPKSLISYHHNTSGYLTRIYQFYYSQAIQAYQMGHNSRYEYFHDSLISYSITDYGYYYGSDSLNPDEFDVEDTYSYYPDGKLKSDSYVNYHQNNGGSIYYGYDPYGFLQRVSIGHISPGDISVDYNCSYYHYAISGPDAICGNDTITLTAPFAEFYLWNTGDTTQSIKISSCYNCNFQCTITLFDGRTYETSPKKINKTVSPVFGTYSTVNYPQCKDNDLSLYLNATNYTNYFWYRRDTLNQIVNIYNGSSTYQASASQFLAGDYFAVASNACGVDTSTVFHVTLISPQPAHITALGPLKFCQGGSVSLLSNPAQAYKWSNNLTTQQISATYGDTYTLRTTDQKGCFSEDHIDVKTIYSPVVPIITQVDNYLIPQTYSSKYQWYLNGNKIFGATKRIYYPSQNGSYSLEFIAPDSSCSKMSAPFTFAVSPLKVNIIDNTKAICANDSIYKGIGLLIEPNTGVPGYTYQWQPSANLIYPDSMFTYFRNTIAGWYKLTVSDALGQIDADSIYISINPQPQAPHLLLPDSVYCEGGAYQKIITDAPNARLYIFYEMNDPQLYSATNLNYINKSSGYSARVMDNNYCISPMGPSLQVNMALQSAYYPLAIYEHQPGFCEAQNILLSTDARPNLRFFWSSRNLGIIPGADSSTITVTPNDYYTVYAMDSSGCTTNSQIHYVNRTFNTYPSISYPLGRSFCLGDSVLIETPYNPLFTYLWKANNTVLPNLDTNRIYTNTKLPNWTYYELTVTGPGCVGKAYANLNPLLPPSIGFIKRDTTLIAYSMDSILTYQWFLDSIAIAGANSISIPIHKQGIYSVLTSNTKGCSGMSYFDFTCGLNYTSKIVSCEDTCSNMIHAIPKGAIPFSYSWNSSPTSKNVNNLCPGNYVMQLSDKNGCVAHDTILIQSFHASKIDPAIVVVGNQLNSNSNYAPVQWYFNGMAIPGATANDLYPAQFGNYQLEFISDDSTCTKRSLPFSFTPLQIFITDTAISFCKNDTLAGIGLDTETTNGVPPYSYQWEPTTGLSQPTEFFSHFNAANNGWYTLTVTDAIGQIGKDSVEVNFLNLPVATLTSQKGNFICYTDSTLLTANYDSTYHYVWYKNGQQILNLDSNKTYADSGAYLVTIFTSQGCSASAQISISTGQAPVINVSNQNSTLLVSGSDSSTYQWFLDSIPILGAHSDSLVLSMHGLYSVEVTNSFGCKRRLNYSFICSVNLSSNFISCADSCSWEILCNSSGDAPFSYNWSNGSKLEHLSNVCPGNYILEQIDSHGCSVKDSIQIEPHHNASIQPHILVSGNHFAVNTSYSPLQWYLNGLAIASANAPIYYPTQSGSYVVKFISDDSICDQVSPAFNYTALEVNLTDSITSICSYDTLAGIGLSSEPATGIAPYTYKWKPTIGISDSTEKYTLLTAAAGGWYTLTVSDAFNQQSKDSIFVTVNSPPSAILFSSHGTDLCKPETTELTANFDASYNYEWQRNGSLIFNANTNTVSADSGDYVVTITNAQGCSTSASFSIHSYSQPQFLLVNQNSVLHAISFENLNYQWFRDSAAITGAQNDSLRISSQGIYSVVATNSHGCSNVHYYTYKCSLQLNSNFASCSDSCSWNINANSNGDLPILYQWNNNAQTSNLSHVCSGFYKLIQTDNHGCMVSDSLFLNKISAEIFIDSIKNTTCIGCNDGAVYFTDSGPYSILGPQSDTSYSNSFNGLMADTFSICAVSYAGCTICRTVIIYDEPLAVFSAHLSAEVVVYPNPFSDKTDFVFTQQDNYRIQITDVLGKEVRKLYSNHKKIVTLNREALKDGIYFYRIWKNENSLASGKIVVK